MPVRARGNDPRLCITRWISAFAISVLLQVQISPGFGSPLGQGGAETHDFEFQHYREAQSHAPGANAFVSARADAHADATYVRVQDQAKIVATAAKPSKGEGEGTGTLGPGQDDLAVAGIANATILQDRSEALGHPLHESQPGSIIADGPERSLSEVPAPRADTVDLPLRQFESTEEMARAAVDLGPNAKGPPSGAEFEAITRVQILQNELDLARREVDVWRLKLEEEQIGLEIAQRNVDRLKSQLQGVEIDREQIDETFMNIMLDAPELGGEMEKSRKEILESSKMEDELQMELDILHSDLMRVVEEFRDRGLHRWLEGYFESFAPGLKETFLNADRALAPIASTLGEALEVPAEVARRTERFGPFWGGLMFDLLLLLPFFVSQRSVLLFQRLVRRRQARSEE